MLIFFLFLFNQFKSCELSIIKLPENVSIIPAVFAFGDSLVDQGNNNYFITPARANFLPYGKDLLIDGKPTGRFSNGKTVPDFLVEKLGIKDLLPAYLEPNLQIYDLVTGVSFASGASGFDPFTSNITVCISLWDQIELFKDYIFKLNTMIGRAKTKYILKNSLFLVVAGNNDFLLNYFNPISKRKYEYDVASYTDLLILSASKFLKEIYKLGARRIAVFGVTKIGCIPLQRTFRGGLKRKCVDKINQAAKLFNQKLDSEIQSLLIQIPQAKMVFIDVYSFLEDIIHNPKSYGFDNVDKGCCGSGYVEVGIFCNPLCQSCSDASKHFFWDSAHPSQEGYKILVNQFLLKHMNNFF